MNTSTIEENDTTYTTFEDNTESDVNLVDSPRSATPVLELTQTTTTKTTTKKTTKMMASAISAPTSNRNLESPLGMDANDTDIDAMNRDMSCDPFIVTTPQPENRMDESIKEAPINYPSQGMSTPEITPFSRLSMPGMVVASSQNVFDTGTTHPMNSDPVDVEAPWCNSQSLLGSGDCAEEEEFLANVRFCISIGIAAYRYGSSGAKVEAFLQHLMERKWGYHRGIFRATQAELLCSVCRDRQDISRTFFIPLTAGLNLNKLGLLADVVDRVVTYPAHSGTAPAPAPASMPATNPGSNEGTHVSQTATIGTRAKLEAIEEMDRIDSVPDPWGHRLTFTSFPVVGSSLAMILGGSWWDCLIGGVLGFICYAGTEILPKVHPRFGSWIPLLTSFTVSTLATIIERQWLPTLNVTLVTLSAIAILLPGYSVSLGISELVSNQIIRGAANFIGGLVTLLWLVIGAWLGDALGTSIISDTATTPSESPLVPHPLWQLVFVPLLCSSLIVVFQVSRRDAIWCCLHLHLTYLTFYLSGLLFLEVKDDLNIESDNITDEMISTTESNPDVYNIQDNNPSNILAADGRNLQVYLSSLVSCVGANVWAVRVNRPQSILLVPALVFMVSGSIGFQGLLTLLVEQDGTSNSKTEGTQQFLQMIVVALLIVAGILTGNTLVEPATTL